MTKIREPLSIEHTLHLLLKSVTADEVKQYTEKSISHFYKCADPDDKDHNLFLQDAKLSGSFLLTALATSAAILTVAALILACITIPPLAPVVIGIVSAGFFAQKAYKNQSQANECIDSNSCGNVELLGTKK